MTRTPPARAIERLMLGDLDRAGETLCAAFDTNPIYSRTFPDPADPARYLPPFWRAIAGLVLAYGETYATEDVSGVAAWIPPQAEMMGLLHGRAELLALQTAVARRPMPTPILTVWLPKKPQVTPPPRR